MSRMARSTNFSKANLEGTVKLEMNSPVDEVIKLQNLNIFLYKEVMCLSTKNNLVTPHGRSEFDSSLCGQMDCIVGFLRWRNSQDVAPLNGMIGCLHGISVYEGCSHLGQVATYQGMEKRMMVAILTGWEFPQKGQIIRTFFVNSGFIEKISCQTWFGGKRALDEEGVQLESTSEGQVVCKGGCSSQGGRLACMQEFGGHRCTCHRKERSERKTVNDCDQYVIDDRGFSYGFPFDEEFDGLARPGRCKKLIDDDINHMPETPFNTNYDKDCISRLPRSLETNRSSHSTKCLKHSQVENFQ
eukprot:Gb_02655 [translate_table: standard]